MIQDSEPGTKTIRISKPGTKQSRIPKPGTKTTQDSRTKTPEPRPVLRAERDQETETERPEDAPDNIDNFEFIGAEISRNIVPAWQD